jgi:hypothetical protein
MIQRIQSIFLFLVVIISTLLFFLTIAEFPNGTDAFIQKILCTITRTQPGTCVVSTYYLGIMNMVIGLVALVTIFLFRNRKLQMLLGNLNMVISAAMIVLMFLAAEKYSTSLVPGVTLPVQYEIGAWLSILLIVFTFLANRYIKKDENLVRSADRIR